MENNTTVLTSPSIKKAVFAVLVLLALFLLGNAISVFSHLGERDASVAQDMVTVTGTGEVFAVPDIATFTYTVDEEGKDVAEANNKSSAKNNAVMKYLKDNGIEDKDIKTEGYNANPKYDYNQIVCIKYPCPSSSPKLVGYEVTQTVSVKVRNTDKAGDILSGVGALGVSTISSLSFTIDNEDAIKAEARTKAIEDAKAKADLLAKNLGVKILGVSGFYEDASGTNPYPVAYAMDAKMASAPVAPDIAKGQNKVTITVNVTYRIK